MLISTTVLFFHCANVLVVLLDLLKQALAAELKSVRVRYDEATAPASAYADGVQFEGGVLTLNFRPFTNPDDLDARAQAIQQALEAKL